MVIKKNPCDIFRNPEFVARIFYYIIIIIPSQDVLNFRMTSRNIICEIEYRLN